MPAKSAVRIYHNPRCAKSRRTLELLRNEGVEPEVVEYLKTPPDAGEVLELSKKLGLPPVEMLRRNEPEFKASGAGKPGLDDAQVARLVARYPKMLQRPIVVAGGKAAFGRPPENALKILGGKR